MDVADRELERMIERRSRRQDPDEQHESWRLSTAAYNARRDAELRAARVEYHRGQAVRLRVVLEGLIARHEGEAAKLMNVQTEGEA